MKVLEDFIALATGPQVRPFHLLVACDDSIPTRRYIKETEVIILSLLPSFPFPLLLLFCVTARLR